MTEIDSYLETMVGVNPNLIVCGDFNIDQLSVTPIKKRFKDVISSNGMNLMDSGITRETSTTKTAPYLFLINIDKNQCLVESISYDITDHYPVVFGIWKITSSYFRTAIRIKLSTHFVFVYIWYSTNTSLRLTSDKTKIGNNGSQVNLKIL